MKKSVCIVGMGTYESEEPIKELSHREMLFYATRKAMNEAGIKRDDIDVGYTASYDFFEGRSLSNQFTVDSIGGTMKACDERVGDEGIFALFSGCLEVMADPNKIVVVAMVQKPSDRDEKDLTFQRVIGLTMEQVFTRPVVRSIPDDSQLEAVLSSMEMRSFIKRTGLTKEDIAKIVVKNMANAGKPATLEDVLKSEVLSGPFLKGMAAPPKDAACTFFLASEEKAKRMKTDPIFVKGIGWASGKSNIATRMPGTAEETRWAARRAYKMANIHRPENDIDVAEINDWYAHRELMHCEALGLNGGLELAACIEKGMFEKNGKIPVNPSGGLIGTGNPTGGAGLLSVARIVEQLRGTAGDKQVQGARYGLAHGWNGLPMASAGVAILSNC